MILVILTFGMHATKVSYQSKSQYQCGFYSGKALSPEECRQKLEQEKQGGGTVKDRIVGGKKIIKDCVKRPWMILININLLAPYSCGGSIINKRS